MYQWGEKNLFEKLCPENFTMHYWNFHKSSHLAGNTTFKNPVRFNLMSLINSKPVPDLKRLMFCGILLSSFNSLRNFDIFWMIHFLSHFFILQVSQFWQIHQVTKLFQFVSGKLYQYEAKGTFLKSEYQEIAEFLQISSPS